MRKKYMIGFLCACLCLSAAACSGSHPEKTADESQKTLETPERVEEDGEKGTEKEEKEDAQPEPLLDADATDEELLKVLGDEVHVVADEEYVKMVSEFQEHTEDYEGQIYQMEGVYATEDGNPCIMRTVVDGDSKTPCSMPLKYIIQEPEDGAWIRVTGIVNIGEINGQEKPLLEVLVIETPETPGSTELPAQT